MDKKARTTITLNGKSYNALSGQPLNQKVKRVNNIDGVVKRRSLPHSQINSDFSATKNPSEHSKKTIRKPAKSVSKQPEPAKTLMRTAVSKPAKPSRLLSRASSPLDIISSNDTMIKKSPMVSGVDIKRIKRARTFQLSNQISRFGATVVSNTKSSNLYRQIAEASKPMNGIPAKQSQDKPDVWEQAVKRATSHEQPRLTKKELKALHGPRPRKHRLAKYTATGLIGLTILAYGVYALMPTVMTKIASVDAGFAASLPGYNPAGFRLASINYKPGQVAFNYKSNIDSRNFRITESSSTWDSATLVSSVIKPVEGKNYKTLLVSGMSIYIYGNNQASWVSNGIWFQVSGNNSLSTNQIVQLATTL